MSPHPSHRPGIKNPRLTKIECEAVIHAIDLVNCAAARFRKAFRDDEWRALQRGGQKITAAYQESKG